MANKRCCNTIQITNNFNNFGFNKINPVSGFDLLFQVNIAGIGALAGASVTINGSTQVTNALGQTTFSIAAGTYPYTVVIAGYTTVNGNVIVAADQTETVEMLLTQSTALFARRTVPPTNARSALDNGLIYNLIDNSLFTKFDAFWMLAAEDTQAANLNWIKAAHDCTLVNAPAFAVDRGYTGNGTTNYINTNYNPTADGVNANRFSVAIGLYSRLDIADGLRYADMGASFGGSSTFIIMKYNATNSDYASNCGEQFGNFGVLNTLGLFTNTRTADNSLELYQNATLKDARVTVTVAEVNQNLFILSASDGGGAPTNFVTKQIAFSFVSSGLTGAEVTSLYNLIQAYLTVLGAEV